MLESKLPGGITLNAFCQVPFARIVASGKAITGCIMMMELLLKAVNCMMVVKAMWRIEIHAR